MPLNQSSAPNVSGIKVSIATITAGVVSTTIKPIGHMDSFGTLIDKSRNVTKFTPMNDTQFEEIIATGSLTQAAYSMGVLYDPESDQGINDLETAIDNDVTVQIIIELNNSLGANGTTIKQIIKVSSFKVDGAKDSKYIASFNAEKIGLATIIPAA
jgi:hypothetical protein